MKKMKIKPLICIPDVYKRQDYDDLDYIEVYGDVTNFQGQLQISVKRIRAVSYTHLDVYKRQIVGSQNAGGVLFNLQGQVIGIITNGKSATDMKNMVCAYGITELKRHIEKMSNGEKFAYLGLKGVDVTEEANSELGVPYGAYIKEVEMDSPAMLAGIQQGDVITGFGERVIISFDEYTNSQIGRAHV